MKKFLFLVLFVSLLFTESKVSASSNLIIYEVYGGGGAGDSYYFDEYIVLKNTSNEDIELSNLWIYYITFDNSSQKSYSLEGTAKANDFYVLRFETSGLPGKKLPRYDAIYTGNFHKNSFSIALVNSNNEILRVNDSHIIDLVGVGGPYFYNVKAGPVPDHNHSVRRVINENGNASITGDNSLDFKRVTLTDDSLNYLLRDPIVPEEEEEEKEEPEEEIDQPEDPIEPETPEEPEDPIDPEQEEPETPVNPEEDKTTEPKPEKPIKPIPQKPKEESKPTKDKLNPIYFDLLFNNNWYTSDLNYLIRNNIIFENEYIYKNPEGTSTRFDGINLLYRVNNSPSPRFENHFSDINSKPINWAFEQGIIKGIGENKFMPQRQISREEFITIIYRYSKLNNIDFSKNKNIINFNDENEISDWAKPSINWAIENNIIVGDNENNLNPKSNIKNSEIISIISRLDKLIK